VGLPLPGDQPDLVPAHGHPAVSAVGVRVQAGAGLQFQNALRLVQRPDAGEGPAQVPDHRLGALPEHVRQAVAPAQGQPDIPAECRQAQLLLEALLGPLALDGPGEYVGDRTEEAPLRGQRLVTVRDVQVQQPEGAFARRDRDAVMAVRLDTRIKGGVAFVNAAGEDDLVFGDGPPAQAGAERHPAAGGQDPHRHADVGLHDQGAGVVLDQKETPLSFAAEPGQLEDQVEDPVHPLVEGDRFQ
jgi:hypothetical protein